MGRMVGYVLSASICVSVYVEARGSVARVGVPCRGRHIRDTIARNSSEARGGVEKRILVTNNLLIARVVDRRRRASPSRSDSEGGLRYPLPSVKCDCIVPSPPEHPFAQFLRPCTAPRPTLCLGPHGRRRACSPRLPASLPVFSRSAPHRPDGADGRAIQLLHLSSGPSPVCSDRSSGAHSFHSPFPLLTSSLLSFAPRTSLDVAQPDHGPAVMIPTIPQFDTEVVSLQPPHSSQAVMQLGLSGRVIGPTFNDAALHLPLMLLPPKRCPATQPACNQKSSCTDSELLLHLNSGRRRCRFTRRRSR